MGCCGGSDGNAGHETNGGQQTLPDGRQADAGHENHSGAAADEGGKTNWVQILAVLLILLFVVGLMARFFI